MSNDPIRFLYRSAYAFFLLIGCVTAFNVVINTYDAFNVPEILAFNGTKHGMDHHSRIAKAYGVRKFEPEWIILGTSRAESAFDPMHPHFQGYKTYNLAFPGGAMYEDFRYLQHATVSRHLRKVTIAIDFQQFLNKVQNVSTDFDERRLALNEEGIEQPFPIRDMAWLAASGAAFGESWNSFKHQGKPSIYRADGYRIDNGDIPQMLEKQGGQMQEFLGVEHAFLRLFRGRVSAIANTRRVDSTPWDDLERILDWCARNSIEAEFVIPAVHARLLALIDGIGMSGEFESWKRHLVELVAQRNFAGNCAVWDFAYANEVTAEAVPDPGLKKPMIYWRESSHATSMAGEAMLAAMSSERTEPIFGNCLTPQNIESLLSQQRIALKRWMEAQPVAFSEVRATIGKGD